MTVAEKILVFLLRVVGLGLIVMGGYILIVLMAGFVFHGEFISEERSMNAMRLSALLGGILYFVIGSAIILISKPITKFFFRSSDF